jgi:hypothetical protein
MAEAMRKITHPYAGLRGPTRPNARRAGPAVGPPRIGFCRIGRRQCRSTLALPCHALPVLVDLVRPINRQMRAA